MKRDSGSYLVDGPPPKFQKTNVDLSCVLLRFLIPARAAGIMIGKKGENIKKIRSQYNVKLNIPDSSGPERIMTIEGSLLQICDIMREICPKLREVMSAKLSDPKRIMGNMASRRRNRRDGNDRDDDDDNMIDFRILVHESQAGSVIGRGGDRIKNLREKFKMRVIKVYQMMAPCSTDRVVQMVAEPENVIQCFSAVVEAVESAPPRGPRENYDAENYREVDALNYGGWLSREAVYSLSQGMPIRPPHMGYNMGGYMMGGDMGYGMGPIGGGMGPMGGGMGPVYGGRGGYRGHRGGMRGGPAPVPPPSGPRGDSLGPTGASMGTFGGLPDGDYGAPNDYDDGYDNGAMYGGLDQFNSGTQYGGSGYNNGSVNPVTSGSYNNMGYGASQRGSTDLSPNNQHMPFRGNNYSGYGAMGSAIHDGGKANQWHGGWS